MLKQQIFTLFTQGRGTTEITDRIAECVADAAINSGLCHIFLKHTSASIILCENADHTVRKDLEAFMARFIKDGDPLFQHRAEGPDDMPAHLRTILTQNSLCLPIQAGKLDLGIWQGIFLWEHRTAPHQRQFTVTTLGN